MLEALFMTVVGTIKLLLLFPLSYGSESLSTVQAIDQFAIQRAENIEPERKREKM